MMLDFARDEQDLGNQYQVTDQINRGLHGVIYQAQKSDNPQEFVAIKKVDLCKIDNKEEFDLLVKEPQWLAQLLKDNNPNIIKLIKYTYTQTNKILMVLELGQTDLEKFLQPILKAQSLTLKQARTLFDQMLNAVSHLHNNYKIVHRDIKFQNFVLVCENNGWEVYKSSQRTSEDLDALLSQSKVKLIDLGISQQLDQNSQKLYTNCGYFKTKAPEVSTGGGYDTSADNYSLGVLLFELLFFKQFDANEPLTIQQLNTVGDPFLKEILPNLLQQEPSNRIDSSKLKKLTNSQNLKRKIQIQSE